MRGFLLSIITAFLILGGSFDPAAATDARQAIQACEKNPKCKYTVRDNGSVDLAVANDYNGGNHVHCPQKGQCVCDICEPPPGKRTGGKGGKLSTFSALTAGVAVNPSPGSGGGSTAKTFPLSGTHNRDAVASACTGANGSGWSNLDSYGCNKENCDGKGGTCRVTCQENTKTCVGETPDRVGGGKRTLGQVLGVSVSGNSAPAVDRGGKQKSGNPANFAAPTGGGILDSGPSFGTSGPSATGTPLAPAAPVGRPGKIN